MRAGVHVDPKAFALRPMRIDVRNNRFIHYEGTTFPRNPFQGCQMYLRRAELFGGLVENESAEPLGIDVLDHDGDILQTFTISKAGFEYLRRQLKFRREPEVSR